MVVAAWAIPAHADPTLKVRPPQSPVTRGRPSTFECVVTWSGDPAGYVILPAELEPVDWGTATLVETRGVLVDGNPGVSQTIRIVPSATGEFQTPAVHIGYLSPEDIEPARSAEGSSASNAPRDYPRLRAAPFAITVRRNPVPAYVAGGAGALLAALLLGWWWVRRPEAIPEPAPSPSAASGPTADDVSAAKLALHDAKKQRLDGDHYGFYTRLVRAAERLGPESAELLQRLQARADEVGYKNRRPDDDSMDADYGAVSRVIKEQRIPSGAEASAGEEAQS